MNADRKKKSAAISVLPKAICVNQRSIQNQNADATDPSGNADERGQEKLVTILGIRAGKISVKNTAVNSAQKAFVANKK